MYIKLINIVTNLTLQYIYNNNKENNVQLFIIISLNKYSSS